MTPDTLSDRLLDFGVAAGKLVDRLPDTRLGRQVAGQMIRSCTSPAPNYEEACAAESSADFEHKLGICLKELRETRLWLRFIMKSAMLSTSDVTCVLDECTQLCNIIAQSIVTSKRNRGKDR